MKNTQRGFVIPLLIIIAVLLGVGGGVYFNTQKNIKEVAVSLDSGIVDDDKKGNLIPTKNITDNKLSDDAFTKALLDTGGKVIARGDVNGDGYEDAITKVSTCGASCATDLNIVINNKNINAKVLDVSFDPGFKSSSATKSDVTNISIKDGIISLAGYGLDCGGNLNQESDICTQEKWSIVKTIKFKLKSNNGASKYYLERVDKSVTITNKKQSSIVVMSPNGGEVWNMGSTQSIKWKSLADLKNKVSIIINEYIPGCYVDGKYVCLSSSLPSAPPTIANDIPNTGEYNWIVGSPLIYGGTIKENKKYKIDIIGWPLDNSSAVSDSSNNYFTVVPGNLLKICPETKINNQMPTTEPNKNPPSVYFILNDQRRELNEFDLDWVEKNCVVKEDIVY